MLNSILIVNSSTSERALLNRCLGEEFNIAQVGGCSEAIDFLRENHKNLSAVLIGIDMAEVVSHESGNLLELESFDLINRIKISTYFRRIPVIATIYNEDVCITNIQKENLQIDISQKAVSCGANSVFQSPYNTSLLISYIKNTIALCESSALSNTLHRDRLTGLYNREVFLSEAENLISAHEPGCYVMASIDIESFKVINDQYGSKKGDELLVHVAHLLAKYAALTNSICCRINADRFALLYPNHDKMSDEIIERFHKAVSNPKFIGRSIKIRIGRYIVNDLSVPVASMYDRAGLAEASIKGRYDVHIADYSDEMRDRLIHEQKIVSMMSHALKDNQFEVWYQPQFNQITGSIIGAEALVRWRNPKDRTLIPPCEFIPVFERNGFIYELDKFVWEETCKTIRMRMDSGMADIPIAINISRQDIFHSDLVEVILKLVEKYNLSHDILRLEITESAFASSTDQIIDTVKQLMELGFIVEIDDFGSAYSSLNTLKDVPATILKLDLKFLEDKDGENSERGGNIVESVVRMAKWLGMTVIAEGVETKEQADFLKSIGCRYVQGYFFARPMPLVEFRNIAEQAETENRLSAMETVGTLNNNAFWDPNSMETLIFNSYVGGACIFEYHNGRTELLRSNDRYAEEFGMKSLGGVMLSEMDPLQFLDDENRQRLLGAIQSAIDHEKEAVCEVIVSGLDVEPKEKIYLQAAMRVIAKVGGHYLLYSLISNNTEKRRAEQKERETAERIKAIMENTKCGITAVTLNDDGSMEYLFINERFYNMLGYTREQFRLEVGNAFDLIVPEDYVKIVSEAKMLRTIGESSVLTMRARCRSGNIVWLRCDIAVIKFDDIDRPVQLSSFSDITAEKEAEEQVRFLNEVAHDILAQPDSEKGIENTLKKILSYFGGDRTYVVEFNYASKYMDATYEVCTESAGSEKADYQHIAIDETEDWYKELLKKRYVNVENTEKMLAAIHREGRVIGYVAIDRPSMELNQPERLSGLTDYIAVLLTRRDLVRQIKALLDNLPCGAALYEFDGKGVKGIHLNKRYWELVDREAVEYGETSVTDAVHPDDRAVVFQEITAAIRQNREARCDIRVLSGTGNYKPFHVEAKIEPKDDAVYSLFVSYTPIDEESMSFQEMLPIALSALMSASDDMTYVKDLNSVYICGSQSMATILGYNNSREIIGKTDYDFFSKDVADGFIADDRIILQGKKPVINYAEEIPDEKGDIHYAKTSKFPLHDSKGNIVGMYGVSHDITKQLETESQLKFLAGSISAGLASFEITPKTVKPLFINEAFYCMAGYSREEYLKLIEGEPFALLLPEDRLKMKEIIKNVTQDSNENNVGELIFRRNNKDGGYRWMNMKCTSSKVGKEKHILNIVEVDITAQKKNEEELRLSEEEYRAATKHSGNTICRYSIATQSLTITSEAATRLSLSECTKGVPYDRVRKGLISEDTKDAYIAFYESIMNGEKENRVSFQKLLNGSWRWINAYASTIYNNAGRPVSAIISYADVTEQLEKELASKVLAETDPLTGIFNRKAFLQKFQMQEHNNPKGTLTALYMIDIDGFKSINDRFGHIAGDKALIELGQKLQDTFRSGDLIARLGGDEFVASISGAPDRTVIEKKAKQLCEAVRNSNVIEGGITISLGIAVMPEDGGSFKELYEKADNALYRVKEQGKNNYGFYSRDKA